FDLMVNAMTASATTHGIIRVTGAGQWRPHLHVRDAAQAFALATHAPCAKREILNVGGGEQNFTVGENAAADAARIRSVPIEHVPDRGDPRSYRVSFAKIRKRLGFSPEHTVDTAIGELADVLASGMINDFTEARYHNEKWLRTLAAAAAESASSDAAAPVVI